MLSKTIRQYFAFLSISQFTIGTIGTVYVLFLQAEGLGYMERNLVNSVFFITLFLFEIPTGIFADLFGRKASFVLSQLIKAVGFAIYATSHTFFWFAVAEFLAAVGSTFSSGAFEAWAVDSMKHHGHQGTVRPILARGQRLAQLAGIPGIWIGAWLAHYNMRYVWVWGATLYAVNGLLAWIIMREEYFRRPEVSFRHTWKGIKGIAKSSLHFGRNSAPVRLVIVFGLLQIFAVQAPNMQWTIYFGRFFTGFFGLAVVATIIMVTLLVGAMIAEPIMKLLGHDEVRGMSALQIAAGVGIIATPLLGNLAPALIAFYLHEVARGAFMPIKNAYLQDNIPSAERATIGSLESIAHHVGGAIGLVVTGVVATYVSAPASWVLSGVVLIVGTIIIKKKNDNDSK